jgi:hypothetical protein
MPRRPPPASPKDRCRAAYQGARQADAKMAATYDRWWSRDAPGARRETGRHPHRDAQKDGDLC